MQADKGQWRSTGDAWYREPMKEYVFFINHIAVRVLFIGREDGTYYLRFASRLDITVEVKPEDVNVELGPFTFQLEPYARVLCAKLELER